MKCERSSSIEDRVNDDNESVSSANYCRGFFKANAWPQKAKEHEHLTKEDPQHLLESQLIMLLNSIIQVGRFCCLYEH